jgi:hypothetical protein
MAMMRRIIGYFFQLRQFSGTREGHLAILIPFAGALFCHDRRDT